MKKIFKKFLISILIMIFMSFGYGMTAYASASEMITEWTIPNANTTITLPASSSINITIDWGDGSKSSNVKTDFPTHTYTNAGTYEIKVSGTLGKWGENTYKKEDVDSKYETYVEYLTKVKQFGELGATSYGFAWCENLIEVSGENLTTANTFKKITSFELMFNECSKLKIFDSKHFYTNNITTMRSMFRGCRTVEELDLSGFNTANVGNIGYMFALCTSLKEVNLSSFDTSGVTDMEALFYECDNLESVDLKNFNTENVTTTRIMFSGSGIETLDLSNFKTSNVTNMVSMFSLCSNLKSILLSNEFKIPTTDIKNMFYDIDELAIILIGDTPLANQFTSVKDQLTSATIYVRNDLESTYENAWAEDFSANKIEPIFRTTFYDVFVKLNSSYVDSTYITVASFDESYSKYYTCYGYSVSKSGEVDTSNVGTYIRTYTLTRNANGTTEIIAKRTRNVIVEYPNYNVNGVYYDTLQEAIDAILESGEIYVTKDNAVDNEEALVPAGKQITLNTNGKTLTKKAGMISISSDATLNIVGDGTIKADTESEEEYLISNSGNLNIKEGNIIGNINAILDESYGTLSIGTDDDEVSTSSPVIVGEIYSVNSVYGFNFYDGVLKGKTNAVYSEEIDVPEGHSLYISSSTVNGEVYESATLIEIERSSKNMVTEWTIPSDNTKIILPAKTINALVDWGDGYSETVTKDFATHTYKKAGVYDITINGTLWWWSQHFTVQIPEGLETYTEFLTGLKQWGELETRRYCFQGCKNLKYVSGDATENTFKSTTGDMSYAFYGCTSLKNVDLTNCNISEIKNISGMFSNCTSIENINFGDNDVHGVENLENMFYKCLTLKSLDLSKFNTSKVTSMKQMFYRCESLEAINLSNFVTPYLNNMNSMFASCRNLKHLDLSSFDTSNVTDMSSLATGCVQLESINIKNFDTSNVLSMSKMFSWCFKLKNLDMSSFNTSNVRDMSQMFKGCYVLENIDITNFDTSNVNDMSEMFRYCYKIVSLDLSNMSTASVSNMHAMFQRSYNLKTILISSDFVISGDTGGIEDIFDSTTVLKSIINISETPTANQFKGKLPSNVTLYVPNDSFEDYKNILAGDVLATQIKPVLELIGKSEITLNVGCGEYQDDGYTVAGFTASELYALGSGEENLFGYSVSKSGDVNTQVKGTYYMAYDLLRSYKSNNTILTEGPYNQTRKVTVVPFTLSIPEIIGEYTYNGKEQTLELKNFEQDKMEISGNIGKNANEYTAKIKLKDENTYAWPDGTSSELNIVWQIKPIVAEIIWSKTSFLHDGEEKTITATIGNVLEGEIVEITGFEGVQSATEVGEYYLEAKSLSNSNYTLEGTKNVSKKWNISLIVSEMNVIMQDFYYGGTITNPSITNNDEGRNVTYYWNTKDSNEDGAKWEEITNTLTLPAGTYYMYAIVDAITSYAEVTTDPVMFKILETKLELSVYDENYLLYDKSWTNGNLNIEINIDGKANVTAYQYKINGNWIDNIPNTITLDTNVNEEVFVVGVNPAGKIVTSECSAGYIRIDKDAPEITNVSYVNENKEVVVTATLNDSLSGVNKYAILDQNGVEILQEGVGGTKTFKVLGSGVYKIVAKDLAGNIARYEISIKKDITPPSGKLSVKDAYTVEDNLYYTNQTEIIILVEASDDVSDSGDIKMAIYKESDYLLLNSYDDIIFEPYAENKEWFLQKENADEKIYLILKDLAGNVNVSFSN